KSAVRRDLVDAMRPEIRYVERAIGLDRYIARLKQLRLERRATVAVASRHDQTSAGDGLDGAIGGNFANACVSQVGDVQIPGRIHGQSIRMTQQCRSRRTAVSLKSRDARAGHC